MKKEEHKSDNFKIVSGYKENVEKECGELLKQGWELSGPMSSTSYSYEYEVQGRWHEGPFTATAFHYIQPMIKK